MRLQANSILRLPTCLLAVFLPGCLVVDASPSLQRAADGAPEASAAQAMNGAPRTRAGAGSSTLAGGATRGGSTAAPDDEALSKGDSDGLLALQLLTAGAQALAQGHAEEALLLLEKAPSGTAADGDRHFLCGVAMLQLDRLDDSVAELRASAAIQPDDVSTHCVLGRVLRSVGDLPGAAAELELAIALEPGDAHLHTLLGHLLLEQEDFGGAFDALRAAVELDAGEVDAHRGLALIFAASGDPEHAALAWRQALALAPDEAELHAGLASTLRAQGLYADALPSCVRAAELQPENSVYVANIASTLTVLGRFDEAREAFERSLILGLPAGEPSALVHANFADLLERLGDLDGAAGEYLAALAEEPRLSSAREALGLLQLDLGDTVAAREQLQRALNTGGLTAEGLMHLARLQEQCGDAEGARLCARILADDDGGSDEVAFRRAQLMVFSDDPEIRDAATAVTILRQLLDGTRDANGAVWNLLGEALAREGAFAGAVEAVSRAVELAGPDHPAAGRYRTLREQYLANLAGH